jgi:hypothetical protein
LPKFIKAIRVVATMRSESGAAEHYRSEVIRGLAI